MSEANMSNNRRVVRCPRCDQELYVVPADQTASGSRQLCPFCHGSCNFEISVGEVSNQLPRLVAKDESSAEVQFGKSIPEMVLEIAELTERMHQQHEAWSTTNMAAGVFVAMSAINNENPIDYGLKLIDEIFP
jgi:hypothetical protein